MKPCAFVTVLPASEVILGSPAILGLLGGLGLIVLLVPVVLAGFLSAVRLLASCRQP